MTRKFTNFDLDARDLEVMRLNTVEGLTNEQTAKQMGISLSTVKRIKRKESYSEIAQSALKDQGYSIAEYVKDLVEGTKAEKTVIQNGIAITVADHAARNQAMKQIGTIYGTDAPKELENRAGIAQMSDEEIVEAIAKSIYEYETATRPDTTQVDTGSEVTVPQDGTDNDTLTDFDKDE